MHFRFLYFTSDPRVGTGAGGVPVVPPAKLLRKRFCFPRGSAGPGVPPPHGPGLRSPFYFCTLCKSLFIQNLAGLLVLLLGPRGTAQPGVMQRVLEPLHVQCWCLHTQRAAHTRCVPGGARGVHCVWGGCGGAGGGHRAWGRLGVHWVCAWCGVGAVGMYGGVHGVCVLCTVCKVCAACARDALCVRDAH